MPACDRPVLLLLLADGGMLAYQAFQPPHHPLAFRRLPLDWTPHMSSAPTPQDHQPHPGAVQPSRRMQVDRCCTPSYPLDLVTHPIVYLSPSHRPFSRMHSCMHQPIRTHQPPRPPDIQFLYRCWFCSTSLRPTEVSMCPAHTPCDNYLIYQFI